MQVGDLVKMYAGEWMGLGIVTALHSQETATCHFPEVNRTVELWRERLEVLCE